MLKHLRKPLVALGASGALLLSGGAATAMADQIQVVYPANSECPNCTYQINVTRCVTEPGGEQSCPGTTTGHCPAPGGGQPFSFGNYDPVNHLFYAEYPGNFCP